jgi:PKD repeat protein
MKLRILGLVVLAALALPSCEDDNDNGHDNDGVGNAITGGSPMGTGGALNVSIGANTTSGRAPLEVRFTSDVRGGEGPLRFSWDFGDGTSSTDPNPVVQFGAGGTFPVSLSVSAGTETITSSVVTVRVDSDVRLACFADPVEGLAPLSVRFRAEPQGGNGDYTFAWSFGDGGTSTERNPRYTYNNPGTYVQTLTVSSGNGARAVCRETIFAYGSFSLGCRASLVAPNTVHLRAVPNFCLGSCTYAWDFGDGTGLADGPNFRPDHVYPSGVFTATVTSRTARLRDSCAVTFNVP